MTEFYPFADEGDWEAHRRALDGDRIPVYDAEVHGRPLPASPAGRLLAKVWGRIVVVLVGGMVLFMYLSSLLIWPLWLVAMSLCKRELARPPSCPPQ